MIQRTTTRLPKPCGCCPACRKTYQGPAECDRIVGTVLRDGLSKLFAVLQGERLGRFDLVYTPRPRNAGEGTKARSARKPAGFGPDDPARYGSVRRGDAVIPILPSTAGRTIR